MDRAMNSPEKRPYSRETLEEEESPKKKSRHSNDAQDERSSKERKYKCWKCEKAYVHPGSLNNHYKKYPEHRNPTPGSPDGGAGNPGSGPHGDAGADVENVTPNAAVTKTTPKRRSWNEDVSASSENSKRIGIREIQPTNTTQGNSDDEFEEVPTPKRSKVSSARKDDETPGTDGRIEKDQTQYPSNIIHFSSHPLRNTSETKGTQQQVASSSGSMHKNTAPVQGHLFASEPECNETNLNKKSVHMGTPRFFIRLGWSSSEYMKNVESFYSPVDKNLFWPDLVLPKNKKDDDDDLLLLYITLLKDLCEKNHKSFLDHLFKERPILANENLKSIDIVERYISKLQEIYPSPTSQVVAELNDGKLVLCVDDQLDSSKFIRHRLQNQLKAVEETGGEGEAGEDSQPVEEDKFRYEEDVIENLRRKDPGPERPVFTESQRFLAESILERIKLIMMGPKGRKFKKCCFQIYTPRANMLESQTRKRLRRRDAECFSIEVYECRQTLDGEVQKCVKKYHLFSDVIDRHAELVKEAKENPDTLFLIVADEAHWGPTSEAATAAKEENPDIPEKIADMLKAYSYLVNTWQEDDYSNVMVLQVSATPYNLLTTNTRLDLDTECTWEEQNGRRTLRLAGENDAEKKKFKLHHVKWDELYEHLIQGGLQQQIKLPLKDCNKYMFVNENGDIGGLDKIDDESTSESTIFHFKGPSTEEVKIHSFSNGVRKTLVIVPGTEPKSKKAKLTVKFFSEEELKDINECFSTFRVTLRGMDVFLLETSDGHYKVKTEGNNKKDPVKVFAVKSFDEKISLEHCFVIWTQGSERNLAIPPMYTSLNFLFHSSIEEKKVDSYLRSDKYFIGLCKAVLRDKELMQGMGNGEKRTNKERQEMIQDILTAEYALHMLQVLELRKCHLKKKRLEDVVAAMDEACGDYTENRETIIEEFLQKLGTVDVDAPYTRIQPELFLKVLTYLEKSTKQAFRDALKEFRLGKKSADNVCSYLVECLLFLRKDTLREFQMEVRRTLEYNSQYTDVFTAFTDVDFEEHKLLRIDENETCRLINDLILDEDTAPLKGPLKIVRMGTKTGNRMYATLCLARKLISSSYTFEILRDYSKFKIADVTENADESSYRIKEILQCKDCSHIDPEKFERCDCTCRERYRDDLKCKNCNHQHTQVEDYADLKDLPCLIILVDKGRMGDTFPENFNAMDLRAAGAENPMLTPLVQELGRLCRYVKRDDFKNIPYALLSKGLGDKIIAHRQMHGTFFDGFENRRDAYIGPNNRAKKTHADYGNKSKHLYRILFEAEPQIGKTGVYLCLISLLRKLIEESGKEEEELDSVDPQLETEYNEENNGTNKRADFTVSTNTLKRPHWKDMKNAPQLATTITTGKYVPLFGPYKFGTHPERFVGVSQTTKEKHQNTKTIHTGSLQDSSSGSCASVFRAYPKNHADSLSVSAAESEPETFKISVSGTQVKLSVPTLKRYRPLLKKLKLGANLLAAENTLQASKGQESLNTWIFTPSHCRHRRAYLNYDHTMVDTNMEPVQYIHILVVRSEEFGDYVCGWGGSHAIVALPPSLPEAGDAGPEDGGIGYARLFIQLMAREYSLPAVFMLDDNIHSVCQVNTYKDVDDKEVAVREDGIHNSTSCVPLFTCLKDLEMQLYGREQPTGPGIPKNFEPFPERDDLHDTEESFTGPWAKYGIIGVMRNSKFANRCKKPFNRTHVYSVVLMNIQALTEKDLFYKPWQVWEDLELNNQCDVAGLWVVKYNKFIVRKVCMPSWLPEHHQWDNTTKMKQAAPTGMTTNCHMVLKKYILKFCPVQDVSSVCPAEMSDDLRILAEKVICKKKEGHQLITVNGKNTGRGDITLPITEAFARKKGKVLLLLPASVCLGRLQLTTREAVRGLLAESIDGDFTFDCITSVNVSEKPVRLVLVHMQIPSEEALSEGVGPAREQLRPATSPLRHPSSATSSSAPTRRSRPFHRGQLRFLQQSTSRVTEVLPQCDYCNAEIPVIGEDNRRENEVHLGLICQGLFCSRCALHIQIIKHQLEKMQRDRDAVRNEQRKTGLTVDAQPRNCLEVSVGITGDGDEGHSASPSAIQQTSTSARQSHVATATPKASTSRTQQASTSGTHSLGARATLQASTSGTQQASTSRTQSLGTRATPQASTSGTQSLGTRATPQASTSSTQSLGTRSTLQASTSGTPSLGTRATPQASTSGTPSLGTRATPQASTSGTQSLGTRAMMQASTSGTQSLAPQSTYQASSSCTLLGTARATQVPSTSHPPTTSTSQQHFVTQELGSRQKALSRATKHSSTIQKANSAPLQSSHSTPQQPSPRATPQFQPRARQHPSTITAHQTRTTQQPSPRTMQQTALATKKLSLMARQELFRATRQSSPSAIPQPSTSRDTHAYSGVVDRSSGDDELLCGFCDIRFPSQAKFDEHMKKLHFRAW